MVSLPVIILSALVLILSGTVVILGVRLYSAKMGGSDVSSPTAATDSTETAALRQERERAALLCKEIRRSLTHICTTIPSAIPGLAIERIQILCADTLKDKAAAALKTFNGFSDRFAPAMDQRELELLDISVGRLCAIMEELKQIDGALTPIFKTWSGNAAVDFNDFEKRLAGISQRFDELDKAAQFLLCSVSQKPGAGGTVHSVQERIRQASLAVSEPEVRAALNNLEKLAQQNYDALDRRTRGRIESYYLETLELVTEELKRAEQAGEHTETRAALSIRVINVLSNIFAAGQQAQCAIRERNLEAEVDALERLAAMRGEIDLGDSNI